MIAMIFEFSFDPEHPDIYDEYLAESTMLGDLLPEIEGFRGVERFQSHSDPNKFVALGFFDDEQAVTQWRNTTAHRRAQGLGRSRFFTEYRLRMAEVTRDYGPHHRDEAPLDSRRAHDRNTHPA